MYGKFALRACHNIFSKIGLLLGLLLFPFLVAAAQKATIIADEAYIYVDSDFDAKIIATVQKGEVFDISENTKGPFYKIRLKDKRIGWISSVDLKVGKIKLPPKKKSEPLKSHQIQKREENKLIVQRWQGLRLESLDWREKTLGKVRSEQMTFVGWGWTGMNTFWQGPFYMDSSVTASLQPPEYYKKVTGVSASGWIIKMQTALLSPRPVSDNFMYFYGFGPVLNYSHIEAGIIQNGRKVSYNLDDLTLGAVIPIGFAYRISGYSLTGWYRFYWEKQTTSSLSLGIGFAF